MGKSKPLTIEDVEAVVRRVLDERRSRRARQGHHPGRQDDPEVRRLVRRQDAQARRRGPEAGEVQVRALTLQAGGDG